MWIARRVSAFKDALGEEVNAALPFGGIPWPFEALRGSFPLA